MKKIKNHLGRNLKSLRTADKLTTSERSVLMSKIKSKGTKLEKDFVEFLKSGCKKTFETNAPAVLGKPDLLFKKEKICIFIDSDFWHGWQFPRWKHKMKNKFWVDKILKNRARDRKITRILRSEGWKVVRIWEHQLPKLVGADLKALLTK